MSAAGALIQHVQRGRGHTLDSCTWMVDTQDAATQVLQGPILCSLRRGPWPSVMGPPTQKSSSRTKGKLLIQEADHAGLRARCQDCSSTHQRQPPANSHSQMTSKCGPLMIMQVGRALDEHQELASSQPEASEPASGAASEPAAPEHTPASEPSSIDRAAGAQVTQVMLMHARPQLCSLCASAIFLSGCQPQLAATRAASAGVLTSPRMYGQLLMIGDHQLAAMWLQAGRACKSRQIVLGQHMPKVAAHCTAWPSSLSQSGQSEVQPAWGSTNSLLQGP